MRGMLKAILSWSSGKDSAMALYRVIQSKEFDVVCLLTTLTDQFHRVSMHGVREELLDAQARSLGYPIEKLMIPYPCPNAVYEEKMRKTLFSWNSKGVRHVIFGDLFLEDIRKYREKRLSELDMTPVFPLWKENTTTLARKIIELGFRATVTCVDPLKLEPTFAGDHFDESFLSRIPQQVDPCGENGEFHTFVHDGPIFKQSVPVKLGEVVTRDGFVFADLIPTPNRSHSN
jgi:uncharacterized protein (TIGR00290 family)